MMPAYLLEILFMAYIFAHTNSFQAVEEICSFQKYYCVDEFCTFYLWKSENNLHFRFKRAELGTTATASCSHFLARTSANILSGCEWCWRDTDTFATRATHMCCGTVSRILQGAPACRRAQSASERVCVVRRIINHGKNPRRPSSQMTPCNGA